MKLLHPVKNDRLTKLHRTEQSFQRCTESHELDVFFFTFYNGLEVDLYLYFIHKDPKFQ